MVGIGYRVVRVGVAATLEVQVVQEVPAGVGSVMVVMVVVVVVVVMVVMVVVVVVVVMVPPVHGVVVGAMVVMVNAFV
jgi:hypothetical protein